MKRIFLIICFVWAVTASMNLSAQTPEEVVERMNAEFRKGDSLGMSFDFLMSIPILGEFRATNYTLGDKLRVDVFAKDNKNINWSDGTTEWTYDSEKNEVKITKAKPKENNSNSGDKNLVTGVSEGYDLSFDKKTNDKVWYITCKKNKSNKEKDDPKRIDLAVSKADYSTIYMKTKAKGIGISMENFKVGVTEAQVTFNPADYPDATIIDER
jgi:outer membrane lipoprotein-sorting protein